MNGHLASSVTVAMEDRTDDVSMTVAQDEIPGQTNALPSTGVTKSSTTVAFWQRQLGLAQVTKLRGNCWRKHGFCINITNFFYPEEALLLYERGFVVITKTPNGTDYMTKQELYEAVLEVISLSCYLTYARLKVSRYCVTIMRFVFNIFLSISKSLDYIVFRHKKSIKAFQDSNDLKGKKYQISTLLRVLRDFCSIFIP